MIDIELTLFHVILQIGFTIFCALVLYGLWIINYRDKEKSKILKIERTIFKDINTPN